VLPSDSCNIPNKDNIYKFSKFAKFPLFQLFYFFTAVSLV